MDNKNLVIKMDKVITIANGSMKYMAYRDDQTRTVTLVKCEDLSLDEYMFALKALQGFEDNIA